MLSTGNSRDNGLMCFPTLDDWLEKILQLWSSRPGRGCCGYTRSPTRDWIRTREKSSNRSYSHQASHTHLPDLSEAFASLTLHFVTPNTVRAGRPRLLIFCQLDQISFSPGNNRRGWPRNSSLSHSWALKPSNGGWLTQGLFPG